MDRFVYKEMYAPVDGGLKILHCVYDNYLDRVRATLNSKYSCKQMINRIQEEITEVES